MSLTDEKNLLKKIEKLKAAKGAYEKFTTSRSTLTDVRTRLNELRSAEKARQPVVRELEYAIKKIKLAEELDCRLDEIVTEIVQSPNPKQLARVVGKEGKVREGNESERAGMQEVLIFLSTSPS